MHPVEFFVLCRSDPTENDSVEGLRPNARGPGLVSFGVCVLFVISLIVVIKNPKRKMLIS